MATEDIKEGTGDMFVPRDCYWKDKDDGWCSGELQAWVPSNVHWAIGVVEDAVTGDIIVLAPCDIRFSPPN